MPEYTPANYYGITPGSILSGTLRVRDLVKTFSDLAIERIPEMFTTDVLRPCEFENIADFEKMMSERGEDYYLFFSDHELVNEFLEYIYDLFNCELSPPYCYFGAHPGDGSDFGFWPSDELMQEAIMEDEIKAGMNTFDHEQTAPIYFLERNDHGNMTLYRIDRSYEEVWSIV